MKDTEQKWLVVDNEDSLMLMLSDEQLQRAPIPPEKIASTDEKSKIIRLNFRRPDHD